MKELLVLGSRQSALRTLKALRLSDRLKGWKTGAAELENLRGRKSLPDVTIVEVPWRWSFEHFEAFASALAEKQDSSRTAAFVFLTLVKSPSQPEKAILGKLLRQFRSPDRIQVYINAKREALKAAVEAIDPAIDVLRASVDQEATDRDHPQPSMLDRMQKVLEVTKDLRTEGGNLSAQLVAELFNVSQTELATWLGRTKQSVFKTPAADSLQNSLQYFERIARLRIALSDEDFRKWLRMPNELLDGQSPLKLIAQGKWQLVADLVADMITGSPT